MTQLSKPAAIPETALPSTEEFAQIRAAAEPVILRGLADQWPCVMAAQESNQALSDYLSRETTGKPVSAIVAKPEEQGRFFYTDDLRGFNFVSGQGRFTAFLEDLLRLRGDQMPPAMAVQSTPTDDIMPHFALENRLALLPQVQPRIWIGNRIRVAPHYDVKENIAVCVAGQRKFTLFPPDQTANLYPGPFEKTPAGTPVSMVDPASPDLGKYPKYQQAAAAAMQATLEPGDAIYIPYCWWHGVESLAPVSCLINYWWNEARPELAGPYDALLHALAAYRHMPLDQRAVWRMMLDHYVFEVNGDPAAHLPETAKGILGRPSPQLFAHMHQILSGKA